MICRYFDRLRAALSVCAVGVVLAALAACDTFGPTGQQQADLEGVAGDNRTGSEASLSPFNWSPPNYAGLTAGRIVYPLPEGPPIVAEFVSGKEAESAAVSFETPDRNVVSYQVGGLRAFEGQIARAEVEKALSAELSDLWQNLAPDIRTGIVDAACLLITKAPCADTNSAGALP